MKHRDLEVLTVGTFRYSTNTRYSIAHSPETEDWTLSITRAEGGDEGQYECQISTNPVLSFVIHLEVLGK